MSTTVTYKGSTLTTVTNETRTLKTSGKYLEGDVILVDVTQATPVIQPLTATPTESEQTFNASGIDGYKPVTVGAISSTYVGSGIDRRDSTDLTASGATVNVPAGYYSADSNKAISNGNIASATWSFNKSDGRFNINYSEAITGGYISTQTHSGNYSLVLQSETVIPTESSQTVVPSGNSRYLDSVTIEAIPSDYVGSGITQRDSTDLTASGATVTAPAGYYASSASASVASGSAGTPIASKGSVSNHSIAVTPSVTNTTGYITGGTKTGTAVTVSASELVSGTYTVSSSGTADVTNYANVSVPSATDITAYYDGNFITQNNVRKWKLDYGAGAIQSGWVDNGDMWSDTSYLDAVAANTTITPTTSAQTVGGVNYMMEGAITVAAIPSQYIIPSGTINITSAGTTDVTQYANASVSAMTLPSAASASSSGTSKATIGRSTSAQYINIPTGYNATAQYYIISATPNGTVTAPSSISGTSATVSTGTNTLTLTKTVSVTPNVTTAGYISSGTAGNASVSLTASVTTKAAATITPGTSNQTIASGTYLTGTQTIAGDADLTAANIKSGVNIFNVTGTFTSDATATASDIVDGETAYVDGRLVTGSLTFASYYTGSSAPSSSLGQDGDIYLQT